MSTARVQEFAPFHQRPSVPAPAQIHQTIRLFNLSLALREKSHSKQFTLLIWTSGLMTVHRKSLCTQAEDRSGQPSLHSRSQEQLQAAAPSASKASARREHLSASLQLVRILFYSSKS